MKKTLRKSVIVFFILSLVFSLGWLGVFAFNGLDLTKNAGGFDFMTFLNEWFVKHFMRVLDLFTGQLYGFVPDGVSFYFIYTYVAYLVAAISLVLMVLGLVFTIKYKRKRELPYVLFILLATAGVLELVANILLKTPDALPVKNWYGYQVYLTFSVNPPAIDVIDIVLTFATVACALFAYVFMIACSIIGFIRAKLIARPEVEEAKPVEAAPAPAEEEKPEEPVAPSEDVGEAFATKAADDAPVYISEKIDDEAPSEETLADFEVEPAEVSEKAEVLVEEVPADKDVVRKDDLAVILKDIVRDIVRDELARNNASKEEDRPDRGRGDHSITGATFGGPLVVQYFNGGINPQQPVQPVVASAPVEQKPQPVEPKKEEPKKEEQPAPVAEPAAEEKKDDAEGEKKEIIRIPFVERMLTADKDMQNDYNELKNEILSYGVNSRVSNSGDTFRLHRKTYVKITIAGKSLKLYFALNPADYADTTIPFSDASHHAVYTEIPFVFKVKSGLSMRRAKDLIRDVMSKDGLEQGEIGTVNWVKELKAAK